MGNNKKFFKKNFQKKKEAKKVILPEGIQRYIIGVAFFLIAVVVSLSFFEMSGMAGRTLISGLTFLVGRTVFIIPLILLVGSLVFFSTKYKHFFYALLLAIFLLVLGISGILHNLNPGTKAGGWVGYLIALPFLKLFDFWVTQIIFFALITVGVLIFWQFLRQPSPSGQKEQPLPETSPALPEKPSLIKKIFAPRFKVKEIPAKLPDEKVFKEELSRSERGAAPDLKARPIMGKPIFAYSSPPIDLLETERGGASPGDTRTNAAVIKKTLQNFDIPVEMSEINVGPTVTQYSLKPAEGVKLSKITALNSDLSLALASHPIRIEAPIPGKSLVGIEVPNKVRAQVRLRELIENQNFQKSSSPLTIVLGRDVSGNPLYADICRMPHLLVAGSTGTGKTIFLNNLVVSLLYRNSPETLRFILIDPKRVEFVVYNELCHLLCPVIFDAAKTVNVLKWLICEMERRFDVLSASKTRDIFSHNLQADNKEDVLPYIVLIIDELADVMAAKGREVEAGIVRLAQMARAVGIHLVVATQRPSVEVITGLIKANITSRITFQVASQVDSRTILDTAGAEKLLGAGDMLFLSAETGKPKRIQSAYVSDKEVKKVVSYLKTQEAKYRTEMIDEGFLNNGMSENLEKTLSLPESELGDDDPFYNEAKRIVLEAKKASASLLQRRLRVGYARAARLIDMLEGEGIVGPAEGARPREVFIKTAEDQKNDGEWQKV